MKKRISFKLFFTVLWRGICQVFGVIARLFGYKDESTYAKVVWRIFAGCVTTVVALFTIVLIYSFVDEVVYDKWIRPYTMKAWVYDEKHISNHIVFQDLYHSSGRIYDKSRDKVLVKDVDWVVTSDDKDSLAVFSKDGKRGYINRFTGEVAIPLSFTRAWIFSEGLAAAEKDGELVFIDHSGKIVIKKDLQVHFNNPRYAFKNGYCIVKNPVDGKMGLIDRFGNWVLDAEYDNLFNNDGFWQVEKDGSVGLYTADLNLLFPVENTAIYVCDNYIEVRHADHIARQYDHKGNITVAFVIDEVSNLQYETTELRNDTESADDEYVDNKIYGIANSQRYLVRSGNYSTPDYYGLLNRNGKTVTPPKYTSIEAIGKNLYLCQPDGVIVNDKGEIVK